LLLAALLGGVLAGGADAIITVATSAVTLQTWNALRLVVLGTSFGAIAALAPSVLVAALSLLRIPGRIGPHVPVLVVGAPLLVYDAFAMFEGSRASKIAGRSAISIGLALLALVALWFASVGVRRLVQRFERAPGRRWLSVVVGLALLLVMLKVDRSNRTVLPRLYPWFHLTLSVLTLVLATLAVRVLLPVRRWVSVPAGWPRIEALTVGVLALALGWVGRDEMYYLTTSQSLRFCAYEKTQVTSLVLRILPSRKTHWTLGNAHEVTPAVQAVLPEGPRRPQADVVLITVDAVRADHVGAYGYSRPTTPNIDRLASQSVRFERVYTQAPHTSFAIASLMTGKYYPTLARLAPNGRHETLPSILRRYGWKTAAFFPPAVFYIDAHKMKNFESTYFDFEYVKYEYLDAEKRLDQIDEFFKADGPAKAFVWLHLFEPHEPYESHPGHDFGPRDIDRYDSEIAYSDAAVGKVIEYVRGKRPNAVIIVAADHGEEFDDHGGRYHGTSLYDEQTRIPLIISVPGVAPHVVSGPVELIDVAATILGLLDIPVPARMRGTDLGPWLRDPPAANDLFPPVFAEVEDKRMIVQGTRKLICDMAKDFCSYFDLAADSREAHTLADERPTEVATLRQRLDAWLADQPRMEAMLVAGASGPTPAAIERGRLADPSAAKNLAEMLRGTAPVAERREAARLLVETLAPRPETRAALAEAMKSADDQEVRDWAAVAASRLGDMDGPALLRALLARPAGNDRKLRLQAALVLGEAGDNTGLSLLTEALEPCSSNVVQCKQVIVALGRLRDARAVPDLIDHLGEVQTRRETVRALGEIADAAGLPALVERLKSDEYVQVRAEAAHALARIGGARALMALQWSMQNEKEAKVREAAQVALAELRRGR
jgi:arylsulfatase A-like enzyme